MVLVAAAAGAAPPAATSVWVPWAPVVASEATRRADAESGAGVGARGGGKSSDWYAPLSIAASGASRTTPTDATPKDGRSARAATRARREM